MQPATTPAGRHVAYILTVISPVPALAKICELLARKEEDLLMQVSSLHFEWVENGRAHILVHCSIDKSRIGYLGRRFEEMQEVQEVDWLHARVRTKTVKDGKNKRPDDR